MEMKSIRDSQMMKECLELRLALLKNDYSLKSEYDKNEIDIIRMKTEMQIDRLNIIILDKSKNFSDLMKIYVQELEDLQNEQND